MRGRGLPWILLGVMAGPVLVACAGDSAAGSATGDTVENVGELPGPFLLPSTPSSVPGASAVPVPEATPPVTPANTDAVGDEPAETAETSGDRDATVPASSVAPATNAGRGDFADDAEGNRVLVIGDSITEAIGPAFGGQLCDDLGRRGWFVGVDAVQGRDIAGGLEALEGHLGDDQEWDAAIVNLGSNYRGDPAAYAADLRRTLDLLRPRPVIVVTATEWQGEVAEVNYVIRDLTRDRPGVWVLEWSEETRTHSELVGDDDLHLTEDGRRRLSAMLASLAGDAPDTPSSVFPNCVLVTDRASTTTTTTRDGSSDEDD